MIRLFTLNPTLISQLLHDSIQQSNTKRLLFVPDSRYARVQEVHTFGQNSIAAAKAHYVIIVAAH